QKRRAARSINAVLFAADHKTVEMRVRPTENNLEDVMEVGDRVVAADQNPSPDGWINPSQQEVELEDFGGVIDLVHDEPSLPARQLPVSTRFFLVSKLGVSPN